VSPKTLNPSEICQPFTSVSNNWVTTEFVFPLLAIHPFQHGNGRLGRALFILALLQSDDKYLREIMPIIAIDRHIEQNRSLYYTRPHQGADGKFHNAPQRYRPDNSRQDRSTPVAADWRRGWSEVN